MSVSDYEGIDAHDTSGAVAASSTLEQQGYGFEALYIDQSDTDSNTTQTETDADGPQNGSLSVLQAASDDLPIVSIFEPNYLAGSPYEQGNSPDLAGNGNETDVEGGSGVPGLSQALGQEAGVAAIQSAENLDQPKGSAIYVALDFDTGPTGYFPDNEQDVQAFMEGVTSAFQSAGDPYKLGVYGSAQVLTWATEAGSGTTSGGQTYTYAPKVTYTWLSGSTGWAGYSTLMGPNGDAATHGWTMIQSATSPTVDGVPVDIDSTDGGALGAWDYGGVVPCFTLGTRILTSRGETPVEDLCIGDTVVTASGEHRSIKWIGRRSYVGRFLASNPGVQPIRFLAGSLGDGLPRRDLLVSPDHAMFLDGLLVPARCLVNGSNIVQERRLKRVDYFHVELDTHDVLLAEGAPSESFIDDDSRGIFHNSAEFETLYPNAPRPDGFCAPRVEQGSALQAILVRLAQLAKALAEAA